ncbi:flagellar basal body P-ring formation protein FlgA [Neptunomonas phycophila]|nr:flagellar basal body P-ring formation protein FlgA [Neptunomonas phycophila]
MSLISGTTTITCKSGHPVSFKRLFLVVGTLEILFSSFLLPAKALAAESLQTIITQRLEAHFAKQLPHTSITIDINSINEGINQRKCSNLSFPIPKALPPGGRLTLRVSCSDPQTWHTYVAAKVIAIAPVAYTARAIAKGSSITAKDIRFVKDNLATLNRGYFRDPAQVIGLKARRSLSPNTALTPQLLEAALLVNKGDSVIIQAQISGLSIRTQGVALEDGSLGEQIDVMNSRSQKVIRAYVISRGVVSATPAY